MVAFLESGLGVEAGEMTSRLESLLAERLLQELYVPSLSLPFLFPSFPLMLTRPPLTQSEVPRPPQGHPNSRYHRLSPRSLHSVRFLTSLSSAPLAHLFCLDRDVEEAVKRRAVPRAPEVDYFSQRHRSIENSRDYDESGERTPLPTSTSFHRRSDLSHSPKPSWANLSGFFNTSMLSLRSGSPSSPQSPDRPDRPPTRPSSVHAHSISPASSPGLGYTRNSLRSQSSFPLALHRTGTSDSSPEESRNVKTRTRTSPNVTFGGTSVALIPSKTPPHVGLSEKQQPRKRVAVHFNAVATQRSSPICWWLTERALLELELIRIAYAELLFRWGMDVERVHVLKLCRSPRAPTPKNQLAATLIHNANGFGPATSIRAFFSPYPPSPCLPSPLLRRYPSSLRPLRYSHQAERGGVLEVPSPSTRRPLRPLPPSR